MDPQYTPTDPRPDLAPTVPGSAPTPESNPDSRSDTSRPTAPPATPRESPADGADGQGDRANPTTGVEDGPDQTQTDTELTGA